MHLIFDFDGTLIDSFHCVMKQGIILAEKFNFRKINESEFNDLRDLSSIDVIKYLGIPIYKIPKLIYQMRKDLKNKMPELQPIPNIPMVLKTLHETGFTLSILTSNSEENVINWLKCYNLQQFFSFIHTESHYFSKKYALKKILKINNIASSDVLYICDETRDIDAAKRNRINSIGVTWGYNSKKALLQYHPTHVAQQPQDIVTFATARRMTLQS